MHARKIVHLDVKPANIMVQVENRYCGALSVSDEGVVVLGDGSIKPASACSVTFKLGDLGLACSVFERFPEQGDGQYLCPELMNERTTPDTLPACDVFSLGVSAYELASCVSLRSDSRNYEMLSRGCIKALVGVSEQLVDLIKVRFLCGVVEQLCAVCSHSFGCAAGNDSPRSPPTPHCSADSGSPGIRGRALHPCQVSNGRCCQ